MLCRLVQSQREYTSSRFSHCSHAVTLLLQILCWSASSVHGRCGAAGDRACAEGGDPRVPVVTDGHHVKAILLGHHAVVAGNRIAADLQGHSMGTGDNRVRILRFRVKQTILAGLLGHHAVVAGSWIAAGLWAHGGVGGQRGSAQDTGRDAGPQRAMGRRIAAGLWAHGGVGGQRGPANDMGAKGCQMTGTG